MFIVITYDVNTTTPAGQKRLRAIAKCCVAHGQRVQNSVFECSLDAAQLVTLKQQLYELMDCNRDSIRIYNLGAKFTRKITHMGTKPSFNPDDVMIL
ncbi:MAG: CRISPR-associated endonuclease Cas2 [Acidaminococcaceae bacterium]|nr:CRISPR-associated endonuclease Cas2 [Acidaminococcaceae bacterium]